jgi:hypothetical protein
VNWLKVDTNTIKLSTNGDSVVIYSTALEYLTAALPVGASRSESFTIRLNSPVTLENTTAVAILDVYKTVLGVPSAINGEIHAVGFPSLASHYAVMGIKSGNFYAGVVDTAAKTDSIYTVIMKPIEPPTFKIMLNSL